MKSIRFRFLVAALAVMLGAAMAKSQAADAAAPPPPHEHGMGMMGHMLELPFKQLDLSDAQREQVKALMQKEHPAMKPLMQQLHGLQQQLKQYSEGTYDDAKVQALVSQQAQTLVQLKVQETRIRSEIYQLLTPEQQTKLKEIETNHEARMQQHMQNGAPAAPER